MESPQEPPKPPKRKGIRSTGRPHRKLGAAPRRPHKYSAVDVAGLVEAVAKGVPIVVACRARNINPDTFHEWLNTREDFALALAQAKQAVILEALTAIKSCATKEREFRNWSWFLETVYRDYFAPPDKGPLFAQNVFTISFEKAREIDATRAKLLPEVNAMLGLATADSENGSEATS